MKNLYVLGGLLLCLVLSCGEPEIIDNYECNSPHSVETIANQWAKTDFKEGEETLDIMAGELCDCFCQINYDSLTKENINARIDKDFMDWSKAEDPVIVAFLNMIACKNYLRGDRGGYNGERDGYTVVLKYKERCAGVEAKRSRAEKELLGKMRELDLNGTFLDLRVE